MTKMQANDMLVDVKGVAPTPEGFGVFLEGEDKVIAIFVDKTVGSSIAILLQEVETPRPLTHKSVGNILVGLDVEVVKTVINDLKDDTFYARLILKQDNELGQKVVEIDMRPSDAIAIALAQKAPVYVSLPVWAEAEDMSWALEE